MCTHGIILNVTAWNNIDGSYFYFIILLFFLISPLLVGNGTRNYYEMACKIQIKVIATFLMIFETQMNIFLHHQSESFHVY